MTQPLSAAAAASCSSTTVDLKVLVLAGDGTESDLAAIKHALDTLGTPYTLWTVSQRPGQLTPSVLSSSCHGLYQGVIQTTGTLAYHDANGVSIANGLSSTETATLQSYEASFGARSVSWYTRPSSAFGLNPPAASVNTTGAPLATHLTAAGQKVFAYVQPAATIQIDGTQAYLATPLSDGATTPLLVDGQGHALAAVRQSSDGRELLALTFNSNPTLMQDLVLWYGLVDWVTHGLFIGARHAYMSPQVDDLFKVNGEWSVTATCATAASSGLGYRMTGADFTSMLAWQQSRRAQPTSRAFTMNLAYIGNGTVAGVYKPDTLTPLAQQQASQVNWINHTYTHATWDAMDYPSALSQVQKNNTVSTALGLASYSTRSLVTPAITGLTTPSALQAAYDSGVRFVVTYASHPGYGNPSPNAGVWLTGGFNGKSYRILGIPRHQTNVYSNVSTPQEELAHDQCVRPAGQFGYVADYPAFLRRETVPLLRYMLSGDADPIEFHEINLRAYDGSHSLVSDLLSSALDAYAHLVTVPLLSPKMDQVGDLMLARMAYNSAAPGLKASITTSATGRVLQLSSTSAISVPVTGLAASGAESYAGESIATIKLAAGGSASFPLSAPTSTRLAAVADTYTDASAPTTSRGSSTILKINATPVRTAFLRFDLSTLTGKTLKSAALAVTTTADAAAGSGSTQSVHVVTSSTWGESFLTASHTEPPSAISTAVIGSLSKTKAATTYDIPLTLSTVQAHVGKLMSIEMESNGADELIVSAREGTAKPELVVTY